jgi:hypothetical protein
VLRQMAGSSGERDEGCRRGHPCAVLCAGCAVCAEAAGILCGFFPVLTLEIKNALRAVRIVLCWEGPAR